MVASNELVGDVVSKKVLKEGSVDSAVVLNGLGLTNLGGSSRLTGVVKLGLYQNLLRVTGLGGLSLSVVFLLVAERKVKNLTYGGKNLLNGETVLELESLDDHNGLEELFHLVLGLKERNNDLFRGLLEEAGRVELQKVLGVDLLSVA